MPNAKLFLDLGDVHELAEVHLNGKNLGVVWSPPFRMDISRAIKAGKNKLEIAVVNFWRREPAERAEADPHQHPQTYRRDTAGTGRSVRPGAIVFGHRAAIVMIKTVDFKRTFKIHLRQSVMPSIA